MMFSLFECLDLAILNIVVLIEIFWVDSDVLIRALFVTVSAWKKICIIRENLGLLEGCLIFGHGANTMK